MTELANMLKLQNGSDVRGIALEGIEGENVNLTPEIVKAIASSFATLTSEKYKRPARELRIGVGHDSRLSAKSLKSGVIEGLLLAGCQVYDCGLCSTPSMFMGILFEETRFDASIMITASHLPFNRNGLKFFDRDGGLNSPDIRNILQKVQEIGTMDSKKTGHVHAVNLIEYYSRFLRDKIKKEVNSQDYEKPLKGLRIVLDAGNGSGGFFTNQVLVPLGADTSGSQFLKPDGHFPNHIPNPENAKAMESIRKATLDSKADLGIIFDTDVDRAAVIFSNGEEVNRNRIIGLTAAIVAKEHPHTTIVTDSVTSDHLTKFLENNLSMKHHRFKRGYKNVINEAIRLNQEGIETHVAIETSGHCAFKENHFQDDGAYLVLKILVEAAKCRAQGKAIEALLEGLNEPVESTEYRLNIKAEDFKAYGSNVLREFEAYSSARSDFHPAPMNYEGVRITFDDDQVKGWLLLRMSLHDPLMPLNIEADKEGGIKVIINRILPFLKEQKLLDISSIKA